MKRKVQEIEDWDRTVTRVISTVYVLLLECGHTLVADFRGIHRFPHQSTTFECRACIRGEEPEFTEAEIAD